MQILIPEPCNASWDAMSPADKGRFCQSCSKTVIDFTEMDKSEILSYFDSVKSQGHSLCGHFKKEQIDTVKLQIDLNRVRFKNAQQKILFALFIIFGLSLFSCTNTSNQTIGEIVVIDSLNEKNEVIDSMENQALRGDSVLVKDSIINEEAPKLAPFIGEVIVGEVAAEPAIICPEEVDGNFIIWDENLSKPKHNEQPKSDSVSTSKK